MKALKEKRIRLRSLWRRGLVILSLFALVFAGCSDSGSDGGGGGVETSMKTIVGAALVTKPLCVSETQYEGFPVDLNGIKVLVRYNDNNTEEITEPTKFYLAYVGETDPIPYYDSTVNQYYLCMTNGQTVKIVDTLDFGDKIKPVIEVHWHGALDKATYFSDDIPDFSGLSLEMRYNVSGHEGLYHKILPLPKEWRYWTFSERWDSSQPYVRINFPSANAFIPLDKIYYVETLTFDPAPDFTDTEKMQLFVNDKNLFSPTTDPADIWWNGDLIDAWLNRLGDIKLKVTYTDDTTGGRTYSVAELKTMRDYTRPRGSYRYYSNPRLTIVNLPYYYGSPYVTDTPKKTDNYINNKKGCTITFAYRGVDMEPIEVPVFGQFVNITAESKSGDDITFSISPMNTWPDASNSGDTIKTLWDKIEVKAWYGLYTDKGTQASKTLGTYNDWTWSGSWPYFDTYIGSDAVGYTPPDADDPIAQGKYYNIRTNSSGTGFKDIWDNSIGGKLTKEKSFKLGITYKAPTLFQNSDNEKTAKVTVNFVDVPVQW